MGSLFGGKKPEPAPVQRMPDAEDPAVLEAKKRAAAAAQARSGRASTVLSARNNAAPAATDGTGAYKNSLLGSAT